MRRFIYYFLQFSWGIIQNLIGALQAFRYRKSRRFRYGPALVFCWDRRYSMGMGLFIFLGMYPYVHRPGKESGRFADDIDWIRHIDRRILRHEYGHTIQSLILGPFYLPLIGLPSMIWHRSRRAREFRNRRDISYFSFFSEKWADHLGEKYEPQGKLEE